MTRYLRRILVALALSLPLAASAQTTMEAVPAGGRAFDVGMSLIGPSIGFGNITGYDFALGGRFERGFRAFPELASGVLGLGLDVDFLSASAGNSSSRIIGVTPGANFHIGVDALPQLDPYVGLGLGIFLFNLDTPLGSDSSTEFEAVLKAGGRYWFTESLAGQAEFRSELAALNLGVMFRF